MRNDFVLVDENDFTNKKISKLMNILNKLPVSVKDEDGNTPPLLVRQTNKNNDLKGPRMIGNYRFEIEGEVFDPEKNYFFVLDITKKKFERSGGFIDRVNGSDSLLIGDYFFGIRQCAD